MRFTLLLSWFHRAADQLQPSVLLAIRLYWGLQFVQTGWGKLSHLDRVTGYFASLGLPFPALNATLAGGVECLGGLALALGLGARVAAVPLLFTMAIAYATAERAALTGIFHDPTAFTAAPPFLFALAALLVLAFGPGRLSLDAWLGRTAPIRPHP